MYNTAFSDLKSALSLNKMSETELVSFLKSAMNNANYRKNYNKTKSVLLSSLKSDPVVQERMKALKAAK